MPHQCNECDAEFTLNSEFEKHITKMHNFRFLCEVCGFETKDKKTASHHKQQHSQQEHFKCDKCNKTIKRRSDFLKHVREKHGVNRFS